MQMLSAKSEIRNVSCNMGCKSDPQLAPHQDHVELGRWTGCECVPSKWSLAAQMYRS